MTIRHCADIALAPDEQVPFVAPAGSQYDVVRKAWGYYATPSLNRRLLRFGLRTALCENRGGDRYVLLVESGCEGDFHAYLDGQGMTLLSWLEAGGQVPPAEG